MMKKRILFALAITIITTLSISGCAGGNDSGTTMMIDYIGNIDALGELKNLQVLNLNGQKRLSDISALSGLTNLRELSLIGDRKITDISALSSLTNLEILYLDGDYPWYEGISDLSPLSNLINLRELYLSKIGISDLSACVG
ncbi:MAG: leucine-rich repeat domain-containing protein [Lachnospiraceae bacterium]